MLAEARTLSEVKKVKDMAEAMRIYARAAHLGRESQNYAAEIAVRASRRAWRVVLCDAQTARGSGAGKKVQAPTVTPLSELGITKKQSSNWQCMASIPEPTFEKTIRETVGSGKELTTACILRLAKPQEPTESLDVFSEIEKRMTPLLPDGADGQLKLADLLESALEITSVENSERALGVCSLIERVAKHFTDSTQKIRTKANRNRVARVA